jgi:hypothetical protein
MRGRSSDTTTVLGEFGGTRDRRVSVWRVWMCVRYEGTTDYAVAFAIRTTVPGPIVGAC